MRRARPKTGPLRETGKLPEPEEKERRLAFGYFGSRTNSVLWICPHGLSNLRICQQCDRNAAEACA